MYCESFIVLILLIILILIKKSNFLGPRSYTVLKRREETEFHKLSEYESSSVPSPVSELASDEETMEDAARNPPSDTVSEVSSLEKSNLR